jgi:phage terminase large subunit GpA-like protein
MGSKVRFQSVSGHRRACYRLGQIPNKYAAEHSGSKILFLTCLVDVHVRNLAVSVIGWCAGSRPYLIDYWRFEREDDDDDCSQLSSPVWGRVRQVIEESNYEADDGTKYGVALTLVDASFSNAAVVNFCEDYASGVYPILGRDRPAKHQTIKEFAEFKTQSGTVGFRIMVDHYKDRMAPILRREWAPEMGPQPEYHFNAPVDVTDKQLKELTVETRKEKVDANGNTSYFWYRPGNAKNELWDLLGYGYAGVEIFAWHLCIKHFELERIEWREFWEFAERKGNDSIFCRS